MFLRGLAKMVQANDQIPLVFFVNKTEKMRQNLIWLNMIQTVHIHVYLRQKLRKKKIILKEKYDLSHEKRELLSR